MADAEWIENFNEARNEADMPESLDSIEHSDITELSENFETSDGQDIDMEMDRFTTEQINSLGSLANAHAHKMALVDVQRYRVDAETANHLLDVELARLQNESHLIGLTNESDFQKIQALYEFAVRFLPRSGATYDDSKQLVERELAHSEVHGGPSVSEAYSSMQVALATAVTRWVSKEFCDEEF